MPKEESFPIPLKCIDVTRTEHTTLDVLQEKRINDYWNVDVDRTLSDSWRGFAKSTLLNGKPFTREKCSPGGDLQKNQATTRPDYLWPEIWTGMSKAGKKKEKQEWAMVKPKLDNARKLRGIFFVDPEDEEY